MDPSQTYKTYARAKIISGRTHGDTPARMRTFLDAYAGCGSVSEAAEIAGISRVCHYDLLERDPVYRDAFEAAGVPVGQLLEDTAVSRALEGDTPLLMFLLKRFKPAHYRERASLEVSGSIDLVSRMSAAVERVRLMNRNDVERAG